MSAPSVSMPLWPAEVSIVVPTLDERENVAVLFRRLAVALEGIAWEMIVVDDDSADGTSAWAKAHGAVDPRIRCLRRVGRRGLAGAAIEGMLSSSAPVVAVMDGDLQHDEAILSLMLDTIRRGQGDLVIGSRHQACAPGAFSALRRRLSDAGRTLGRLVLTRDLSDPMSGFFMLRRDLIEAIAPRLVTDGFKVLVDILFNLPPEVRVAEVGYVFRERRSGTSKLDLRVLLDYGGLLVHRLSGDMISARMTTYLFVGTLGLLTHLALLHGLARLAPEAGFDRLEIIASYGAMATNFALNNVLTFRERRARGWMLLPTFALFCGVCSMGVLADIGVADWAFARSPTWWVAGLVGALVSTFWNYAMSASIVWSPKRVHARVSITDVRAIAETAGRASRSA